MPNTVQCPHWLRYVETAGYILLLLFIVPIKFEDTNYEEQFQVYLKEFNKSYANQETFRQRFEAFKISLRKIATLNRNKVEGSALYGLTEFSDMLPGEFLKYKLLPNISQYRNKPSNLSISGTSRIKRSIRFQIPSKVDWRNMTSDVVSQKWCGACWAFSVTGAIETLYAIKTGNFHKLSVQQMIDCSKYNDGCEGGDICTLLKWIKQDRISIVKEEIYPLSLSDQTCKNISSEGVEIHDFECDSFLNSEDVILALLAKNGPVAVAINAQSWQHYVGGTIQFHCDGDSSKLNHAVEIVGYDLTAKIPHYIVRNSWGQDFGDKGYLYLAIGENMCGLANEVAVIKV